ncbi:hypothetical protein KM043_006603 [Ampulex compressa]|nr:hypothetical protein KM043_006603 [Ampulex compressa]
MVISSHCETPLSRRGEKYGEKLTPEFSGRVVNRIALEAARATIFPSRCRENPPRAPHVSLADCAKACNNLREFYGSTGIAEEAVERHTCTALNVSRE